MVLFALYEIQWAFLHIYLNNNILNVCEASHGAGAQSMTKSKIDWLWVQSSLEEIKYLPTNIYINNITFIFSCLPSDVEAKHGVKFCHSTHNASRIRQKVRYGVF